MVLPWLAAASTFAAAALLMLLYGRPDYHDLLPRFADCTYRFRPRQFMCMARPSTAAFMTSGSGALTFAYACHFYAVRVHARAVV